MIIKWLESSDLLQVTGPEVDDYAENPSAYTGIKMTATESCGTAYTQSYSVALATDPEGKFWVDIFNKIIYVTPAMIGLGAFRDSIIKLDIKFQQSSGYVLTSNCTFVDVTYSCKVGSMLESLLSNLKETSGMMHLLHYSLTNGSNCGCNCPEMCEIFVELTRLLTGISVGVLDDCNC